MTKLSNLPIGVGNFPKEWLDWFREIRNVTFGSATTEKEGLIRIATQDEVDAGTDATIAVTPATLPKITAGIAYGTSQAIGSNSSITVTLPAGKSRYTILLDSLSGDTNSVDLKLQIGGASGLATTGYNSACMGGIIGNTITGEAATDAFILWTSVGFAASRIMDGIVEIMRFESSSNTFLVNGQLCDRAGTGGTYNSNGRVTLTEDITQFKLYLTGGLFDSGTVNYFYE